jgi:ubiquinone/menaquinone biosynthesis C-methylase UbiE
VKPEVGKKTPSLKMILTMNVPQNLLSKLRTLDSHSTPIINAPDEDMILCEETGQEYPAPFGIPSMTKGGADVQDWNVWDMDEIKMMGDSYYKRANGDLPEKEASKSYARLLQRREIYKPGDQVLDIGCATGHFLRSFQRILDPDIHYTGIDTTARFLKWGGDIFGISDHTNFVHGDALDMPFVDNAFDIVIVNLFHFFPNVDVALKEAMRVAKRQVIWRTPIGEVNYIVKIVYNKPFEELGLLTQEREDFDYTLYTLFSKEYIEGFIPHLGGKLSFIERDTDFGEFDNNKEDGFDFVPATKSINGMQINGNLVLDWQYVGITSQ